jgi:WD40 repeat protein
LSSLPGPSPLYNHTSRTITSCLRTDFIVTTSIDGHLKFWKKMESGIEFVKHYHAHLAPVIGVSASADGAMFASVGEDGTCKVFDVLNFGAHARAPRFPHRRF